MNEKIVNSTSKSWIFLLITISMLVELFYQILDTAYSTHRDVKVACYFHTIDFSQCEDESERYQYYSMNILI